LFERIIGFGSREEVMAVDPMVLLLFILLVNEDTDAGDVVELVNGVVRPRDENENGLLLLAPYCRFELNELKPLLLVVAAAVVEEDPAPITPVADLNCG
jgi:hypothetical protein